MKHLLIAVLSISLFTACQQGAKDPKSQLDDLKKQQVEISNQIKKLEAELAKTDAKAGNEKPTLVSVMEIKPELFQHFIEVRGKVDAEQNVEVSPQMPGTITSVLVTKGVAVKKGQVLATTDATTILSQIDVLKKQWELANMLYEKQKVLWDQQIGTEVQYLSAKNQKESLEKNIETMEQQYELTKIKSPINGTVDEVYTKIGAMVSPGFPAFRVVNYSLMKVKSDLSESYAGKVKVGDLVYISVPGSEKEIAKKITAVSQVIDPNSRSFTVDILLNNEDDMFLHPNMIAILKICDYSMANAVTIPLSTVQNTESGKFVFTVKNDGGKIKAEQRTITTGKIYGSRVEILSGLQAGDQLITVGFQDLSNGQLVSFEPQVASK